MATRSRNPAVGRTIGAVESACGALGASSTTMVREMRDHVGALEALGLVEERVLAEGRASPSRAGALAGVLGDLHDARAELLACEVARQRSQMTQVSARLARLRSMTTLDDLAESIPLETCELGYDRAMFSFVDRGHWVPRSTWGLTDTSEARQILDAGSPPYVHVRELMEADVVRRCQPILVTDCQTNQRLHPRIWPVSQSKTYVAAPVVARNHVAGMVHLDRNVETGGNDDFDRDLLAMFCQGVGVVLDRLLDADRPGDSPAPSEPAEGWREVLTAREHEVLRLVAAGMTNAQVSNRLSIGHETTKTHVRRLMKKLGAHTRTEASALYHESRRPTGRSFVEVAGASPR